MASLRSRTRLKTAGAELREKAGHGGSEAHPVGAVGVVPETVLALGDAKGRRGEIEPHWLNLEQKVRKGMAA
jgi:hypothetical protein